ncbi:MAG: hypothetical protein GY810_27475 [Aureispira sp.]|nr:hypothetical protein [Aureispira sp.]
MISPDFTLTQIPQELDAAGWQLELNKTNVSVYSKAKASDAKVIGFKTVTEHFVPIAAIFKLLKDVCGAMHSINHMFVLGEEFRAWPSSLDQDGKLVRTSFKMPFPMADREFLHGLHSYQADSNTYIVAYTPIEESDIKVQKGYVRCPMYISGQRITALSNGATRVEHLMVYNLGGKVSEQVQDRWLKKSHVGAYIKEWEKLGEHMYPTKLEDIDYKQLSLLLQDALEQSQQWPKVGKPKSGTVKVGRLAYCPRNVYRTDIVIQAPIQKVVDVLADQSLKYLPLWNKEFMNGEVLEVLEDSPSKSAWVIRVHYQTPFFLSNREYIYYFSREWINDEECLIFYHSVEHESAVPKGFVRSLLYPTVHRCTQKGEDTLVEHLLATDLGGKLSSKQDGLLKGGLVQAHCRDMANQEQLFKKL